APGTSQAQDTPPAVSLQMSHPAPPGTNPGQSQPQQPEPTHQDSQACKIGPDCRKRSLTWAAAPSASARIGPCRILLWAGLVVSVDRGAQIGGEAGVGPLGGAGRSGPPASRAEVSAGPYASLGGRIQRTGGDAWIGRWPECCGVRSC